jgi:hypothetical protein
MYEEEASFVKNEGIDKEASCGFCNFMAPFAIITKNRVGRSHPFHLD